MAKVSHKISIGSSTYQTGGNLFLSDAEVQNSIDIPVSFARLVFQPDKNFSAKVDDPVSVELGTGESTTKVFTGKVKGIEYSLDTVTVVAVSQVEMLARTCLNKVYESKSCGDIIKDLASAAEVKTGTIDEGIRFPRYIVMNSRNTFQHIKQLAKYCGADVFTDAEDKLNCKVYKSAAGTSFKFGSDILNIEKEELAQLVDGIQISGESPAGQGQSEEANYWLKKEAVSGSAGSTTGNVKRIYVFAARNKDLCDTIAGNMFNATKIKSRGRAVVLNGEAVAAGGSVKFSGIPGGKIDGPYKVTTVKHKLNGTLGFVTELLWEEVE
jgi:hypothetical protein